MKNVQTMMALIGQTDSVITFDLAIYVNAKKISGYYDNSLKVRFYEWEVPRRHELYPIKSNQVYFDTTYLIKMNQGY